MAQTVTLPFTFGSSKTGLTDLRAQPLKSDGTSTGSAISTLFTEIGRGMYQFDGSIPDDAVAVKAYSVANPTTVLDHVSVAAYTAAAASSGSGITVIDSADAILTTTSPTTDSDNGTVTIYTGAAYTGTGEGITKSRTWTSDSLDGSTATLYVLRQDLYEDPTDATAWTALDTATVSQSGTTIAVAFNPSDTATAALEWGLDGSGQTIYRAHVVIAASKKPLWDFLIVVKRGEWA